MAQRKKLGKKLAEDRPSKGSCSFLFAARLGTLGREMPLLFPIPGPTGQAYATNESSARDKEVLRALQPALIVNLTCKQCPGCTLFFFFSVSLR